MATHEDPEEGDDDDGEDDGRAAEDDAGHGKALAAQALAGPPQRHDAEDQADDAVARPLEGLGPYGPGG